MEQNPVREQLGPRRALDYQSLDAWRGIACLAVVFFHCVVEMRLRGTVPPGGLGGAQYGRLGVQIFFVISGFCIAVAAHSAWRKKSWGKFVWARITRIYPPLWGALALVLLLKFVGSRMGGSMVQNETAGEGPLFYLANLSLLNYVFHQELMLRVAWSLCCEITFYAIVFVAMVATARAPSVQWMLNALHALSLGIMVWLLALLVVRIPGPAFPLNLWPQFGVGVLVFDSLLARAQNEEKRQRFLRPIGLAFATLSCAFLVGYRLSSDPGVRVYFDPFAVSFGFAAIMWLAYRFEDSINRWNFVKLLRSIGTFSYSIYLVHFTLIMALSRALFSRVKFLPWFAEVIVLVLFSVGSGWLFYQLIEKPSQKLKRASK